VIIVWSSILLIFINTGYAQQESKIDSLENLLGRYNSGDTSRIHIFKQLASAYLYVDAATSISYIERALALSARANLVTDAGLYDIMGHAYDRIPNHEKAVENYNKALDLASSQGNHVSIIRAELALGWHYYRLREMNTGIKWFKQALDHTNKWDYPKGKQSALFGLGVIYGTLVSWENMYDYLHKFISLADSNTEQRWVADAYRLIGEYYRNKDEFQEAINNYQKTFDIAAEMKDSSIMAIAVNHMAWAYYEMGDLDKSLELYQKNFEYTLPQGRQQTLANIYGNIGNIYRDQERYPEALENYETSAEIAKESGDIFHLSWVYEDISMLYARMGDYKSAYDNFRLHSLYSDSLMSKSYQEKLFNTRLQYEAVKKAQDLEMLNLRLERNRYLIYGLVAGIALLLILGTLLIFRSRYKATQRIEAMGRKILELTQANLRQQMNPHFIFNTLNSIQYYVFQNDKIASNNYMTKFASLIRKTLENSRNTSIPIQDELETLRLYLELEALRFKEKFSWSIEVDDEIDTLSYRIPTMLIQPYVENAITHGLMNKEDNGYILVKMEQKEDSILCTIEDNGIGRKRSRELQMEKNQNHVSLGTSITENRLRLVHEVYGKNMKVKYTDLVDEKGKACGTRVEISIPIIT